VPLIRMPSRIRLVLDFVRPHRAAPGESGHRRIARSGGSRPEPTPDSVERRDAAHSATMRTVDGHPFEFGSGGWYVFPREKPSESSPGSRRGGDDA
jgi:hypothetical protein